MIKPNPSAERRFLLLQIRDEDDPMRNHEVGCFARSLGCESSQIEVHDLIGNQPDPQWVLTFDAVLVGGSGDYSVAEGGTWLPDALLTFQYLFENSVPTFASCWGFQAFARAMGGRVVTDLDRAELGTISMHLTDAGKTDPIFGPLGSPFVGQLGHQDIVDELPESARLLASSERVANEAFTFPGKPIYATQFHPELTRDDLLKRMIAYPDYLEKITGLTIEQFRKQCQQSPETSRLLKRFNAML